MRYLISFLLVFFLKFEINVEEFKKIRYELNKIAQNIKKTNDNKLNLKEEEIIPFDLQKNISNKNNIDIRVYETENFFSILSYFKLENKKFRVVMDTGSFDLFFISEELKNIKKFECGNDFCNCTKEDGFLGYGSMKVSGKICNLHDNIFNKNILYKFLLANKIISNVLNFDGLLGLGPCKTERYNNKSFPELFDKTHMIFDLHSSKKKITLSNACEFQDDGAYNRVPSIDKKFFSSNVILKIGNKSLNSKFIFDSGTSLIVLPLKFYSIFRTYFISKNIKYGLNRQGLLVLENIDSLPKIDFQIGNYIYSLEPSDYYLKSEGYYILKFQFNNFDFGILGLAFLKYYGFCHDIVNNTSIFLSTKHKVHSSKSNLLLIIILVIVLIIIIIIVVIVLIKKKKKKKNDSLL